MLIDVKRKICKNNRFVLNTGQYEIEFWDFVL